jgi:peptidoglycan/xylan/chitin deacetylase (PgdA/CDA1 family)
MAGGGEVLNLFFRTNLRGLKSRIGNQLLHCHGVCYCPLVFQNAPYWPRIFLIAANLLVALITILSGFSWSLMWVAFGVHGFSAFALFAPYCDWLCPVASRFTPSGREVWLTIDDGPDGENTRRLAEDLAAKGVRATFFVKGRSLLKDTSLAEALLREGHSLANHTESHPISAFWILSRARLRKEIDGCNEALRRAGVRDTQWFRSPLGFKNIFLHPELARRGMRLVGWSARGRDGYPSKQDAVVHRIAKRVKPGAIILLHEGMPQSNETILRVVDMLIAKGYSFTIPPDKALI